VRECSDEATATVPRGGSYQVTRVGRIVEHADENHHVERSPYRVTGERLLVELGTRPHRFDAPPSQVKHSRGTIDTG
jgi:hypothetical protein